MKENIIAEKTLLFGIRIVRLSKRLEEEQREYVLSKQIKRSGTAPGALVRESKYAESKKDFVHKLNIALKEANETDYWLSMLLAGEYISDEEYQLLREACNEIISILAAIVRTTRQNLNN
jgi:four helix bundle protein